MNDNKEILFEEVSRDLNYYSVEKGHYSQVTTTPFETKSVTKTLFPLRLTTTHVTEILAFELNSAKMHIKGHGHVILTISWIILVITGII